MNTNQDIIAFDDLNAPMHELKVIGVGGGGCNAVNHMYNQGIRNVTFAVCNTDKQALEKSPIPIKIQLGEEICFGEGAGSKPEIGRQAALATMNEIEDFLTQSKTNMVFITSGMGGGTGTGAAPEIAKLCKSLGILTVGIVTIPFIFEGRYRVINAIDAIEDMIDAVDSLLIINNQKLLVLDERPTIKKAFAKADDVLSVAARSIANIITSNYDINIDFADVRTVMQNSGTAVMGSGKSSGENRAEEAFKMALNSPLLNSSDISGAKHILFAITGHPDSSPYIDELQKITQLATSLITGEEVETHLCSTMPVIGECNIIWGHGDDDELEEGELQVILIATNFDKKLNDNDYEPDYKVELSQKEMIEKTTTERNEYERRRMEKIYKYYEMNKQQGKSQNPWNKRFKNLTVEQLRHDVLIHYMEEHSAFSRTAKTKN